MYLTTILRFLSKAALFSATLFLLRLGLASAAEQPQEASLNPGGDPYEISIDQQGDLWLSDYGAAEIWRVDPQTAAYTVYENIQAPSDARADAAGKVWWADGDEGRFGRLDPGTGQATWWPASGASGLLGTQVDGAGDFWVVASGDPLLYRFQPGSSNLCTYSLPGGSGVDYPLAAGGAIWLGDYGNGRILRLNVSAATVTTWQLPGGSSPANLALDAAGDLWFADQNNGVLARLDPDTNMLDAFDPPEGAEPYMVALSENALWYGEQQAGTIGRLWPGQAAATTVSVSQSSAPASVSCAAVEAAATATVSTRSGTLAWASADYPLLADGAGWRIYDLPDNALPWGVAVDDQHIWYVDNGRLLLGRIPLPGDTPDDPVTVIGCVVDDADGDPLTTDDRTPLAGWTITLLKDGSLQDPGKQTGTDGCAVWEGLPPNVTYGLAEDVKQGWFSQTPPTHDFGLAQPGDQLSHTFVNTTQLTQEVSVTACALQDADGDPSTTGDQSFLEGWTVGLLVDGQQQGPSKQTDVLGCAEWSELAPNVRYGVTEELAEGWFALNPTSHDFGVVGPGEGVGHNFIVSQMEPPDLYEGYLPMVVRP